MSIVPEEKQTTGQRNQRAVLNPIIPPKLWPKTEKRPKRDITLEEHQKIIQHENNTERRLYYEILWEIRKVTRLANPMEKFNCQQTAFIDYRASTGL